MVLTQRFEDAVRRPAAPAEGGNKEGRHVMALNFARSERELLCRLFEQTGPDAPTLCGAWTTRDLAAHLIVRESRPDAALGILIPALAGHTERVQARVAQRPWPALIAQVRNGPPRLSPTRLGPVEKAVNTLEFFVHHEDVRRCIDGWEPRALSTDEEDELWNLVTKFGKRLVHDYPGEIVVRPFARTPLRLTTGPGAVTLSGPVGELVMYLEGRQSASRAEVVGPEAAVEAINTASFGI